MAKSKTTRVSKPRAGRRTPTQTHKDAPVVNGLEEQDDLLWDFAFDQMVGLMDHLLEHQVLNLNQMMHVIRSFARATETAGCYQSFNRDEFAETLVACAMNHLFDHCQSYQEPIK
jgi:hypothetical protein